MSEEVVQLHPLKRDCSCAKVPGIHVKPLYEGRERRIGRIRWLGGHCCQEPVDLSHQSDSVVLGRGWHCCEGSDGFEIRGIVWCENFQGNLQGLFEGVRHRRTQPPENVSERRWPNLGSIPRISCSASLARRSDPVLI